MKPFATSAGRHSSARTIELVEVCWRVLGDGRLIICEMSRLDGGSFEVRVRHGEDIIRTQPSETLDVLREVASEWHEHALEQGFSDVLPTYADGQRQ